MTAYVPYLTPGDACPLCGHMLSAHYTDFGCQAGWEYNDEGIVTVEGCECHLSLATEHGGRRYEL